MTTITTSSTAVAEDPGAPQEPGGKPPKRARVSDTSLYVLLTVLILAAWQFTKLGYFTSGDDVGYWIGVAGGVMMLLLFSYPLRKYFRFAKRWGSVKWWFVVHMLLGIGGPLLILVHSTFHLGSVNAAVAMFSMLIVAGSGIVGRFLYLRIHRGLHGERSNLAELQKLAGLAEGEMKSRFRFAPGVAEKLLSFEAHAAKGDDGLIFALRRVLWLPVRQRMIYTACEAELVSRLRMIARERQWTRGQLRRRRSQAKALAKNYLRSVLRVAQFTAYERLFALWHVLHVPFVYLLVLTACFHVFAVHAY